MGRGAMLGRGSSAMAEWAGPAPASHPDRQEGDHQASAHTGESERADASEASHDLPSPMRGGHRPGEGARPDAITAR